MTARAALALALALWTGPAGAACRQALALGLDVSGSVDAREHGVQREGLAAALTAPEVLRALLSDPQAPLRLAVFEWSGPRDQRLIVDWTEIGGPQDVAAIAARLRAAPRAPAAPTTALGAAMLYGGALLSTQADCWRRVLDLSGDGPTNTGPRPQDLTPRDLPEGIEINGLAILTEPVAASRDGDLAAYYRDRVIRGPEAFVEVARGFEDFEAAMRRKLLREMRSLMLGDAGLGTGNE